MEDDLNGRGHQWKMTSIEDDCNGIQPQMAYLANFVLTLAQLSPSLFFHFLTLFMANDLFVYGYDGGNLTVLPPRREAVSPFNSFLYSVRGGGELG